jgi:tripartite-type tricarboxylate transporter receptor subunit TctC
MASAGSGSAAHVFGALFMMLAGVDMIHVPYRGNPLPDLLSGQVQVFFGPIQALLDYVRTGKLRALAVTTAKRSEALPQIPSMADVVPGYEASGWQGVGVPKSTPPDIVARLNQEINATLANPQMKARLANLGDTTFTNSPADFGKLISDDIEKWGKVIRAANIKAD